MGHNNPSYLSVIYYPFLYLQREERLEARYLALQKAVEQQTHPKTGEEEGKNLLPYKTAQRVQRAILQNLRQNLGAAATLPEEAAKDLILQVNLIPLSVMSTITIQTIISHSW